MIVITGGAGFIGSNFVLDWLSASDEPVVNLDLLTCAGNLQNLFSVAHNSKHTFVRGNIGNAGSVASLLKKHQPCSN
jgi:dTDP-glucose 4,6-dehydratase